MWQNQDCSWLSLALEIKQGHPYLFPVPDGNNRAGGGMFLRIFFSFSSRRWCSWPPVLLTWWPLSSAMFWLLSSSLFSGLCLSGYCQTQPWACIPWWPLLYFSPALSKPVFWKDCPCLSTLLSHLLPVKALQLDSPSPPTAESFSQRHHSPTCSQIEWYVLCLLTETFCCDCHGLYWETQDFWFSWDCCSSFFFYFLDCFSVQTFLPAMCGILGLPPKCLWKLTVNFSETLWTCWCHVGSLKLVRN